MSLIYKTNNLMMLLGGDFYFVNRTVSLVLFEIIEYFRSNITAFHVNIATPSEYFDAIFTGNDSFPVFGGDFFPNIIEGAPYMRAWTGYFTTRPYLKSRIAGTQRLVRSAELLQSLVNNRGFIGEGDDVGTHHDAFTGTCLYEVFQDYVRRLDRDYKRSLEAIGEAFFAGLEGKRGREEVGRALMVPYKVMVLFNPINWRVRKLLSFTMRAEFASIMDGRGNYVQAQTVPVEEGYEVYFMQELEPLGFKVLFVNELGNDCDFCSFPSSVSFKNSIRNEHIGVEFERGLISKVFNKDQSLDVSSSIMGYNSSNGGPYCFYPEVISI